MGKTRSIVTIVAAVIASSSAVAFDSIDEKEKLRPKYDLKVLEDRGGELISHYLPKREDPNKKMLESFHKNHSKTMFDAHFPVVTKGMSVGRLTDEEVKNIRYDFLTRSVFIVGYDPVSLKWMKENKAFLADKKAIGLVINVKNRHQLNEMQSLVGDQVVLQPTPGDTFVEHVKIKHYPFYVDANGVIR